MASKISGVGVHTIRAWEKRYKALEPIRDTSGHRTYTKIDIEKLMLLSELCLLGYTISKVAKLSIPELKSLLKDLGKVDDGQSASDFNLIKEKPVIDASLSISILLFALKAYKLDVINQELGKIKYQIDAKAMVKEVLLPLMSELTVLRTLGEYNSNKEQALLSLLRFHSCASLCRQSDRIERYSKNVAIYGLEGEENDLNSIMASLLGGHYFQNSTSLGSGMSVEALTDLLVFLDVQYLILNAHYATQHLGAQHVLQFIEKIFTKTNGQIEIIILANTEFQIDKIPSKRLTFIKTIQALDEFLAQKIH